MNGLLDVDHTMGGDLSLDNNLDLVLCSGLVRSQQRVLRRLLTNPGDYLWQPDYGGGLKKMVGSPQGAALVRGLVQGQLALEEGISQPQVAVQEIAQGLIATVQYQDDESQKNAVLNVEVNN